jgi:hypothetical protein
MLFRRAIYLAMFPAAVILPVWLIITRGIVANDVGWTFLIYLFACPALFVLLMIIGGLVRARKAVRVARAVSWWDAGVLGALYLALVASGIFAVPAVAVADVILVIGAFWLVGWELITETRTRVTTFVSNLETGNIQSSNVPPARGPVIIIEPGTRES